MFSKYMSRNRENNNASTQDNSSSSTPKNNFEFYPISQSDCEKKGVGIGEGICSGAVTSMIINNEKIQLPLFTREFCQKAKFFQVLHECYECDRGFPLPHIVRVKKYIQKGYEVKIMPEDTFNQIEGKARGDTPILIKKNDGHYQLWDKDEKGQLTTIDKDDFIIPPECSFSDESRKKTSMFIFDDSRYSKVLRKGHNHRGSGYDVEDILIPLKRTP
jgi:hypothetical protein